MVTYKLSACSMKARVNYLGGAGKASGPIFYFLFKNYWDFPGGPVVKTLHFYCRGCGFDLWSAN